MLCPQFWLRGWGWGFFFGRSAGGVDQNASDVLRILANIIIRQANKTSNPRQYIEDLLLAKFTSASAQGGVIISTTVNGKSATFQALPGTTIADFMVASTMALEALEAGLSRVQGQTYGVLR